MKSRLVRLLSFVEIRALRKLALEQALKIGRALHLGEAAPMVGFSGRGGWWRTRFTDDNLHTSRAD